MSQPEYSKLRNKIKNGDVVFIKNSGDIFAKVIRFFTFSPYSHVGIAVWVTIEGERRLMMVETRGGTKKRIVNMSMYSCEELDIIRHQKVQWSDIRHSVLDRLGEVEYSWSQALYVGIREYFFKKWAIHLPSRSFSGMICSEFVATVYQLEETNISPQVLYEQLISRDFVHIE